MNWKKLAIWAVALFVAWWIWKQVQIQITATANADDLGDDEYYPGWAYAAPLVPLRGATYPWAPNPPWRSRGFGGGSGGGGYYRPVEG